MRLLKREHVIGLSPKRYMFYDIVCIKYTIGFIYYFNVLPGYNTVVYF